MAYLALIVEDVIINKWELNDEVIIIGRAPDCDIQIDEAAVSSKHARILLEADPYLEGVTHTYLEDLRSTNGTLVNGQPIKKHALRSGDEIQIGFNHFRYVDNNEKGLDETAVIIT